MEKVLFTKDIVSTIGGAVGGLVAVAFGGWSDGLLAFMVMMAIDYITGLMVAGIFKASPKTASGGLESRAGLKGLMRKIGMILFVVGAHYADIALGTAYFMNATIIGFIANELISILENACLMEIPMPESLKKAIDIMTAKSEAEAPKAEE